MADDPKVGVAENDPNDEPNVDVPSELLLGVGDAKRDGAMLVPDSAPGPNKPAPLLTLGAAKLGDPKVGCVCPKTPAVCRGAGAGVDPGSGALDRLKGVELLILAAENVLDVPPELELDWNSPVDPNAGAALALNDKGAAKPPDGNGVDEAAGANADLKAEDGVVVEVEEETDSAKVLADPDPDFPKRLEGELTVPKPKPPKAAVGAVGISPGVSVRSAAGAAAVVEADPNTNRFDDGAFDGIGG